MQESLFFVHLEQKQLFMKFSPSQLNTYLFFKIPAAFWCGVRVDSVLEHQCTVKVKHSRFNQNPFKSIYFAVQEMAGELATGVLIKMQIEKTGRKISMLVSQNNSSYFKKAKGVILFTCTADPILEEVVAQAILTSEGQSFWMKSIGVDEEGDQVCELNFLWSIKLKP